MKKQIIYASMVLFATMMMTACSISESGTQSDEVDATSETVEETITATTALKRDALRAPELSCLAQANVIKGKEEGLSIEEIQTLNAEYNLELTEINNRFYADYDDNENKDIFQQIFEEAFADCSGN
jgi:hypothetical protein